MLAVCFLTQVLHDLLGSVIGLTVGTIDGREDLPSWHQHRSDLVLAVEDAKIVQNLEVQGIIHRDP